MSGYRKLIAAGIVFAAATVLTVLHFLSGAEWVTTATLTLGAYTAGNVVSKFSGNPDPPGEG